MISNSTFLFSRWRLNKEKPGAAIYCCSPAGILDDPVPVGLWSNKTAAPSDLAQGYTSLLYQLPMMNAILCPSWWL